MKIKTGSIKIAAALVIASAVSGCSSGDSKNAKNDLYENTLMADSKVINEEENFDNYPKEPVLGGSVTRDEIDRIKFLNTLEDMPKSAWDVSENKNKAVMAWTASENGENCLYIAGEGGVYANTDSSDLFFCYKNVKSIDFNGCFYTENAENMSGMFFQCGSLSELNLTDFNTSNVTDMSFMFCGCENLQELDLTSFDTSNVIFMNSMFENCEALEEVNLSSFNTSNAEMMDNMFSGCTSLKNLDISNFDMSKADTADMFKNTIYE